MKPIEELFLVHRARSDLFSEYVQGEVAYIGNSIEDNGVVGYVTPLKGDRVFRARSIVISAFCEATVQAPPFVAWGRAGNGLVVLEPREPMTVGQLAHQAAYINAAVRWRFNWYRQVTVDRLKRIPIPAPGATTEQYPVEEFLPESQQRQRPRWCFHSREFSLESLFRFVPGDFHSLNALRPGKVPVVSCGNEENGIAGFYDIRKPLYANRLTIALNGSPMATKFHPYSFAAKDDVAVCLPVRPLRITTLLFIQAMLERERWRYSYYRKCYLNKLGRFAVALPAHGEELDEDTMEGVIAGAPYWDFLNGWSAAADERS